MRRRDFVRTAGGVALTSLTGCSLDVTHTVHPEHARLSVVPSAPTQETEPGKYSIDSAGNLLAFLQVPPQYDPATEWPLVVALHGAGITASGPMNFLGPYADEFGFVLLAPNARAATWDVMTQDYGNDIAVIDQVLTQVFSQVRIDPQRIFLEGFSDGASYALGVGLTNDQLFKKVVAFSPGFICPYVTGSTQPVFVSHAQQDPILSFTNTKEKIVPKLESEAHAVEFVEYDGGHSVPPGVARSAMNWLFAAP